MFITLIVNKRDCLITLWDYSMNGLAVMDKFDVDVSLSFQEQFMFKVGQWFEEKTIDAVVWQKVQNWQDCMVSFIKDWLEYIDKDGLVKILEIPLMCETQLSDIARISGLPEIERAGIYDKVAHEGAIEIVTPLPASKEEFIVVCMGDNVSVAAYRGFDLLDVNNSRDGEGPMGLRSSGSLFSGDLIKWALSSGRSYEELYKRIVYEGGWEAWKGHITQRKWEEVLVYQILKEIGSMRAVLKNEVKEVIFTGTLAARPRLMHHLLQGLPKSLHVHVIQESNRSLGLARIWVKETII